MREINGVCPICGQSRLLRSINYIDDRIRALIVSADFSPSIDYICYSCRDIIDRGIKGGKDFTSLPSNDFILQGYGLRDYLEDIHKDLNIDRLLLKGCSDFIDQVYSKINEITNNELFKYHLATLIRVLEERDDESKKDKVIEYFQNHFTNTTIEEIYSLKVAMEKLFEIMKNYYFPN